MPVRCHPYPLNYPDLLELNCTHPGGDWAPASVEAGEWDSPALQLVEAVGEAAFWPYGTRPSSLSVSTHRTHIQVTSLHRLVTRFSNKHSGMSSDIEQMVDVWPPSGVLCEICCQSQLALYWNYMQQFTLTSDYFLNWRKRHLHFKSCKSAGHSWRRCDINYMWTLYFCLIFASLIFQSTNLIYSFATAGVEERIRSLSDIFSAPILVFKMNIYVPFCGGSFSGCISGCGP